MTLFRRTQYWSVFWTERTSPHCLPTTSGIILILFSDLPLGPSFVFSNHNFVDSCRLSDVWHKPRPSQPTWFYYWHLNKIRLKCKLLVLTLWTFVQPHVTFRFFIQTLFWNPCYQHPFWNPRYQHPQSLFSSCKRQRFTPWQISKQHTSFLCVHKSLRSPLYS